MVPRESPVASATRMMPPRPSARASTAAPRRRARSSRRGSRVVNLASIARVRGFRMKKIVATHEAKRTIYFGETPYSVAHARRSGKGATCPLEFGVCLVPALPCPFGTLAVHEPPHARLGDPTLPELV